MAETDRTEDAARWQAELALKQAELDLRRREMEMRAAEARVAPWRSPLALAIGAAAVAAIANVVVAYVTSGNQLRVEAQRAEAQRILEAIRTEDPDQAWVSLEFLVRSGLVDEPIASRIEAYLAETPREETVLFPAAAPASPAPPGAADRTDVDLFRCEANGVSAAMLDDAAALLRNGGFGRVRVRREPLTAGYALDTLRGHVTIIYDEGHPEEAEVPQVGAMVAQVHGMPPPQGLPNLGALSRWYLSVIVCP